MNLKDYLHSNLKFLSDEAAYSGAENESAWKPCKKKLYNVKIMRSDSRRYYNANVPGAVYNFLEDSVEPAPDNTYIVEGTKGELWVISTDKLADYDIAPEIIGYEPVNASTKMNNKVYFYLRINPETTFLLKNHDFCLTGNRPGIEHGSGDCLLTIAEYDNGKFRLPMNIENMWVVNGEIFKNTYLTL